MDSCMVGTLHNSDRTLKQIIHLLDISGKQVCNALRKNVSSIEPTDWPAMPIDNQVNELEKFVCHSYKSLNDVSWTCGRPIQVRGIS